MRLRNIAGAREAIEENHFAVKNPAEKKGNWKEEFGNRNEIEIEIGMGKGKFIMELARLHPEKNYIGIEKFSSVLYRGLQKLEADPVENIRFIRMEAEEIEDSFEKEEVSRIYLNFSDPWPKDRHAKRRLPSRQFLDRFRNIIKKEGTLEFKTDNRELFEFALEETGPAGWVILDKTTDLHHDLKMNQGNVMTEYEERFSRAGKPICKMIIKPGEREEK